MVPKEKSELWQIMHYSTFYNISVLFLPCCVQFTLSSCSSPGIRKVKPLLTHFTCSQHILLFESQSTFDIKGSQGVYYHTFFGQDSNKNKIQLKSKSNQHQQSNILRFLSVYSGLFRMYWFNCVASATEKHSRQLEACRNRRIWDKWQCIPCRFIYLRKRDIWKKQQCCLSKQTFWKVFL